MEQEFDYSGLISSDLAVSFLIGIISTLVFLYCYISFKKSYKLSNIKHLKYFAFAFLCYFLADIFNYSIFTILAVIMDDSVYDLPELVLSGPSYLLSFAAAVLFVLGAKSSARHASA